MQRFVKVFLLVCCSVFSKSNFAQDIRGAWIEYKWISGYTYSITASMIIDSANKTNHSLSCYFGDGDSTSFPKDSISFGKVIIYKYSTTHTYSGPGVFTLYCSDKYRIGGINNIPNSYSKSIFIESLLSINQFMGPNSSPSITAYPIYFGPPSGNQVFYNPGLSDPDGDSLSYQLINCSGFPNPINYYLPSNASVDAFGTLSFHKDSVGVYAFAYLVKQWRKDLDGNWVLNGHVIIDFVLNNATGVGIKEFDKKESVNIYPNPVSNILNIKSNSKNNSEIEIINCLGQTILKQNYSESIDVSKLESGYYILKVTGDKNYYSKFIKE
jgi:hypothetical protein